MIHFCKEFRGEACAAELVKCTGLDRSFLLNENNWVSFETYNLMCDFLKREFEDDRIMYRVGLYSFSRIENFGSIAKLGLLLLTPENIYRRTPVLANASVRFGVYEPLEITENRMLLEFRTKPGYPFYQHNCDYRLGVFAGIPQIYGMPVATHRDVECVGRGDDRCVYEFSWSAPRSGWRGRLVTRFIFVGLLLAGSVLVWKPSLLSGIISAALLLQAGLFGYLLDLRKAVRGHQAINEDRADEIESALVFANQKYHEASETVTKLEAMVEATTAFNLRLVNRELYELVLEIIKNTLRYDRAMILFKHPDENILHDAMIIGETSDEVQQLMVKDHTQLDRTESPVVQAFLTKKSVLVSNVNDFENSIGRQALMASGTKSMIAIPLRIGSRVIGTLAVHRITSSEPMTGEDLRVVQTLVDMLAVVLENSELYQNLEKRVKQRTSELVSAKRQLERAYDDLKQTQSQLLHSEKMASIGKLVAGIAHELNNPAGIISGYLELMDLHAKRLAEKLDVKESPEDLKAEAEELESCIEPSRKAMRRIKAIVEDLRNFARLDETELMPADLNEGLQKMLPFFKNKTQNRIEIITQLKTLPVINCYPGDLNQAFSNIFENAVESIKAKGKIIIRSEIDLTDSEEKTITVTFEDDGSGIAPADLDRVFDPFFTTKEVGEGRGLGLSIAYGIIKRHNGKIVIQSELGKGTTVEVTLPVRQDY